MSEDLPPSPFLHGVCDIRIAELKNRIAELERENAMLKRIERRKWENAAKTFGFEPIIAQDANETEGA